jgi:succinoglycan biosynthesis protein ExoM
MIKCSVCIATYKRPELLEDLLHSLVNQQLPEEVKIEVIIVDNDAEGSAECIVNKFHNTTQATFHYFRQPIKNISITRNMAVEKATGDYILFIDDDEVASREWVANLLTTIKNFDADGVFGRVIPNFNENTPNWMKKAHWFYGNFFDAPTGSEAQCLWTGNCLLKASILKEEKGPFDPAYGVTGGADPQLFERLRAKSARFVYCYEALVSEYLPPARTCISYLVKRGFRGGNGHTRRIIELGGKRKLFIRFSMVPKALCYGLLSLILALLLFPSIPWRTYWIIKLASNAGRFMGAFGWYYGWYYQVYK